MFVEFRVGSSLFLMHDTFFQLVIAKIGMSIGLIRIQRVTMRLQVEHLRHNLPKTGPKNLINMMTIDVDFFEGFVWG